MDLSNVKSDPGRKKKIPENLICLPGHPRCKVNLYILCRRSPCLIPYDPWFLKSRYREKTHGTDNNRYASHQSSCGNQLWEYGLHMQLRITSCVWCAHGVPMKAGMGILECCASGGNRAIGVSPPRIHLSTRKKTGRLSISRWSSAKFPWRAEFAAGSKEWWMVHGA